MINPRETLQEALDKKGKDIHPSILARFFVEETAMDFRIRINIHVLGMKRDYVSEQVVSKALFEEATFKKELAGPVDFVVDAIAKRISFEARYV